MPLVAQLIVYPVKSCAGIPLREATVTPAGLMHGQVHDREWMVVDENGDFLTQRDYPRMAVVTPRIETDTLALAAPGMPSLEIPIAPSLEGRQTRVRVWDHVVKADDCGDAAAAWFSQALGTPCRLVRFDPDAKRFANPKWTGGLEVPTLFSDGYPVLVISQGSLDDLNEKLCAQGRATLPMNRFRPNLVLDGLGAFEEDYAREIRIGAAILKPVKPCPRCPIPSVDQATGETGPDPLDILRTYRVNPKVDGGITFGMNAILLAGEGTILRVGQETEVEPDF